MGDGEARVRSGHAVAAAVLVTLVSAQAAAQDSPWNVSYPIDGSLIAAFAGGSYLLSRIDVDTTRRWDRELLGWDEGVRGRYSASAAARSDTLGLLAVTGPMFAVAGDGLDESAAHRGVIYVEALGASMLLNSTAKYVVQRPRPYAYSTDPAVMRMTAQQRKESHLSFYSGHAAITFTAAVAGSYMFSVQSENEASRATLWGVELALASATANLRVRAGKHFYSDVLLGALVGSGIGYAVPRLHLDGAYRYSPSTSEVLAMAGGVAGGTLLAWVLPVSDDIRVGLGIRASTWFLCRCRAEQRSWLPERSERRIRASPGPGTAGVSPASARAYGRSTQRAVRNQPRGPSQEPLVIRARNRWKYRLPTPDAAAALVTLPPWAESAESM